MGSAQGSEADAGITRDASDLRRGMRLTLLSYLLKASQPALIFVMIRLYGAAAYGVFSLGILLLGLILRVLLFGLDKGVLWWVSHRSEAEEREVLGAVLLWGISASALAVGVVLAIGAEPLAAWAGEPGAAESIRWMAIALVPMTVMEILVLACVGKRRLEAHVIVKESLVTQIFVAAPLVFWFTDLRPYGLALGFTIAQTVGMLAAIVLFRRAFAGSRWSRKSLRIPRHVLRYSLGVWVTEVLFAVMHRLDAYMLAALTDPASVGVYQGARQVAQNVQAVRASFEPMVVAVIAESGLQGQRERVRRGFSHAMRLVLSLQVPLVAAIVAFAAWLMPLMGEDYHGAASAVLILSAAFLLQGSFGLAGQVVSAYGRSFLNAVNTAIAALVGLPLHFALIPGLGVDGAAWAMAASVTVLAALQSLEARVLIGQWYYTAELGRFALASLAAAAAMATAWVALALGFGWPDGSLSQADAIVRLGAAAAFLAVFVPFGLRWRPGLGLEDVARAD